MTEIYNCGHCGTVLELSAGAKVSRNDTCDRCRRDLRCCINCEFYDLQAYNHCREPQADRVLEKDRANFCDYFKFSTRNSSGKAESAADKARKQLDDLFKD